MIDTVEKIVKDKLNGRDDILYIIVEHEKDDIPQDCVVIKLLHKQTNTVDQRIFSTDALRRVAGNCSILVEDAVEYMLRALDGRMDK